MQFLVKTNEAFSHFVNFIRHDYEGVDKAAATAMFASMRSGFVSAVGRRSGEYLISVADDFTYTDPVDGAVAHNQGIRYLMADGSRIVFRMSGTAGSGATVRIYLEKYEPDASKTKQITSSVMSGLVKFAVELSQIQQFTGFSSPTVIT